MYKSIKDMCWMAWTRALETAKPTDLVPDFREISDERQAEIMNVFEDWYKKNQPSNFSTERMKCQVCGISVFEGIVGYNYMVTRQVWEIEAGLRYEQFAHIGCLETKIGRKLTPEDFTNGSINSLLLWLLENGIEIPKI